MEGCPSAQLAKVCLRQILPDARWIGAGDLTISGVTESAAAVQPGFLFAAIRGSQAFGGDFAAAAVAQGAVGVLVESPLPGVTVPQIVVPHAREAYSRICAALVRDELANLRVIGVTGTNGKTTSAWLMRSLFQSAGQPCGVLGTIEYHDGVSGESADLTTPSTGKFWSWLQRMGGCGTRWAAVELSSHALHQRRVAGLELSAAIVTNVTHDHLDYHGSFDDYWTAKSQIFGLLRTDGVAVVNRDDAGSWQMRSRLSPRQACLSIAIDQSADVVAEAVTLTASSARFRLRTPWGQRECRCPLIGRHNLSNVLGVAAAALFQGLTLDQVVAGIEGFSGVPGRLERIDAGQSFSVFVDYAHTDDALSHVLTTLRPLTRGRLICVFGAGGDRDRTKRPKLGQAALAADVAILTSDNPRSEDPRQIAEEIASGMTTAEFPPMIELDRSAAIRLALNLAASGDCVVIAGKGHERVQVIGDHRLLFDDAVVARRELLAMQHRPATNDLRNSA